MEKTLEFCHYALTDAISRLDAKYRIDHHESLPANMDALVLRLHAIVAGEGCADPIDIYYPSTWVQAVKERFAPKWVLRKWPVMRRHHHIEHKITYPNVPCKDLPGPYVKFSTHARVE